MSLRTLSVFALLVASSVIATVASAQVPPPCLNADKIGCSHHPTYGWISGSAPIASSSGATQVDTAAQAAGVRAAYDQMIARIATENERARLARLPDELAAIAAGNTPDVYRSFVLAKNACLDSNMAMGCGHYAQLMKRNPVMECRERHERTGTSEGCPVWGPPPAEIAGWASQGCARGDGYACEVRNWLAAGAVPPLGPRSAAAGAAPLVASEATTGAGITSPMPLPVPKPVPVPVPVVDEGAYRAYRAVEDRCLFNKVVTDCISTAQMILDNPDLLCRAQIERKFQTACHPDSKLGDAHHYASMGCNARPVDAKGRAEACALAERLTEQRKQAGDL